MKTISNTKISIRLALVIIAGSLFLYYVENKFILYPLVILLISSTILNKALYLKLKTDGILIKEINFLFIPTYKLLIKKDDITNLYLLIHKNKFEEQIEFEATIIADIITGIYFYKPKYILVVELKQNKQIELEINSRKKRYLNNYQLFAKITYQEAR